MRLLFYYTLLILFVLKEDYIKKHGAWGCQIPREIILKFLCPNCICHTFGDQTIQLVVGVTRLELALCIIDMRDITKDILAEQVNSAIVVDAHNAFCTVDEINRTIGIGFKERKTEVLGVIQTPRENQFEINEKLLTSHFITNIIIENSKFFFAYYGINKNFQRKI